MGIGLRTVLNQCLPWATSGYYSLQSSPLVRTSDAVHPKKTETKEHSKMCGIVALFSRRDPISTAVMQRATQSLYHRGPDGQWHWIAPDARVALGHARLSIIDLTTGDQPIASENERTRIVVNGEFYGYESIMRELE